MRVILDANIFVSAAISPHGPCGAIVRIILENPEIFELILTEKIILETIASLSKPRVIKYSKHSIESSKIWIEDISSVAIIVPDLSISFKDCRDPDDIVYLAAADTAKASFIVSGDQDLLVLKRYGETEIKSPTDFIFIARQIVATG
jgi:putative PIN family toxin of toxin-antitoxin system